MSHSNISPSSQKVDDFLLKISQLSQDRLRDSQRTNRSLQAELARGQSYSKGAYGENWESGSRASLDFGISELSFNRSGRSQGHNWNDGPLLPSRPGTSGNEFRGSLSSGGITQTSSFSLSASKLNTFGTEATSSPFSFSKSDPGMDAAPKLPRRQQTYASGDSSEKPHLLKSQLQNSPVSTTRPMIPVKPKTLATANSEGVNSGELQKPSPADTGPKLPQRPSEIDPRSFGLIRPVASREPLKVGNSHLRQSSSTENRGMSRFGIDQNNDIKKGGQPGKILSFTDIENRIKHPPKEKKPFDFSGSESSKVTSDSKILDSSQPTPASKTSRNDEKDARAVPLKPTKPAKHTKPTLKTFESKDIEILRDQRNRLSPTKTQQNDRQQNEAPTAPKFGYGAGAASASRDMELKVLKPLKPQKPPALSREPEAVMALGNLKKSPPKTQAAKQVPEALQKFHNLRKSSVPADKAKPPVPRKISSGPPRNQDTARGTHFESEETPQKHHKAGFEKAAPSSLGGLSKPDIQAQLANIFRSLTAPSLQNSKQAEPEKFALPQRSSTVPEKSSTLKEAQKLTHPNKSRAKGPKRKLPKSQALSSSGESKLTESRTAVSKETSATSKGEGLATGGLKQSVLPDAAGPVHSVESDLPSMPLHVSKPRRTPPAIAKKPNFPVRPARKFSGEVFI